MGIIKLIFYVLKLVKQVHLINVLKYKYIIFEMRSDHLSKHIEY